MAAVTSLGILILDMLSNGGCGKKCVSHCNIIPLQESSFGTWLTFDVVAHTVWMLLCLSTGESSLAESIQEKVRVGYAHTSPGIAWRNIWWRKVRWRERARESVWAEVLLAFSPRLQFPVRLLLSRQGRADKWNTAEELILLVVTFLAH